MVKYSNPRNNQIMTLLTFMITVLYVKKLSPLGWLN